MLNICLYRHALAVQKRLKDHYIPQISAMDHHNGEKVEPPFPLAWYPNELAWAMTTPKNILRRHPPFASFQRFLVSETSVGNISRQEAVSMIPPLLMDIRPGMTVLDLCAAPGSKAAQLIEMVHAGEEVRTGQVLQDLAMGREPQKTSSTQEGRNVNNLWADDGRSTGLLIANDADYKRSHMLIHQMKRLNSPNLIVTNHDATAFPSIRLTPRPPRPGQQVQHRYLKFDRILADVPCSGDGTMRKNPNIWKDWNPSNAMGLHQTQIRILVRALQMLKVGGRVVYSTCSMNPVENEAVIASAIERCGGSAKVSIVDCSNELGELKRRPGLSSWSVMDKVGRIWNSWAEVEAHRETAGLDGLGRIIEGMFAPKVASDGKALPFERCMRVYGHLQDTGAFFITVLEKLSEIKARPEAEPRSEPTFVPEPSPSVSQRSTVASAAPISEMIEKLSETHETNGDALQKLDALDALLPPEVGPLEDASAAARQNQENEATQTSKRGIEDIEDAADATMATKRPKFRDEVDEKAPEGAEDRQVHWPPPPGAELDLTRHQSTTVSLETPVKAPAPTASADSKKNKSSQPYEEPFKYLPANHKELEVIYDFYRLSPRFPRDRFLVRNAAGDPAKTIYYSTELAKEILSQNEGLGIKFVHCGVKMFMKQDTQKLNTCKWRIQTEGMQIIEGWVGEGRVVRLQKRETLRKLLIEMFPKVNQDGWRALGEIGERVRDIDTGCCVLRVEPSDADDEFRYVVTSLSTTDGTLIDSLSERMVMPLWKSLYSLNLMLPKEDRR